MTQRPSPPDDLRLWSAVDEYFEQNLNPPDPALESTIAASRAARLPEIQVSPLQGKLLYLLARARGARRILEIGTLGGYSTLWLARALPPDGRLVSLELDPRHAEVARSNLSRAGLGPLVDIQVGPALESLQRLDASHGGGFDLVFIDADKPGYPDYLEWALRLTNKGALLIVDNVVRRGDVIDAASSDPNVRGVRTMVRRLAELRGVEATVVQTVGVKGHDGFALVRVD